MTSCKRCGATNRKLLTHRQLPMNGYGVYAYPAPRLVGLRCTTCWRALRDERRAGQSAKRRAKTYGGLTEEEYHRLRGAQHDRCPLCARPLGQKAVVDHDHDTGRVRGVLCGANCNRNVLGIFAGDRPEPFQRALDYLADPPAARVGIERYGSRKEPKS